MKLIPMTDFVLEQHKNPCKGDYTDLFKTVVNYAEFLKKPLKLGMFVPVDEEGNVLDEKEKIENTDTFFKHGVAREKVLFKEMDGWGDHVNILIKNKVLKTIGDLCKHDLELTESAIKQVLI